MSFKFNWPTFLPVYQKICEFWQEAGFEVGGTVNAEIFGGAALFYSQLQSPNGNFIPTK